MYILAYEDGSKDKSWIKYRTVGLSKTCTIMHPIHVCQDDRWILCSKLSDDFGEFKKSNNLFYYNLETDQVEDYKETDAEVAILQFVNYVQSLISPNNIYSMY